MNILDVHQYLAATLLPTLAITDPVTSSIQKVYPMTPDVDRALTDIPCVIMPGFELQAIHFNSAYLEQLYAIHLQFLVRRAEVEQGIGAQMAAAYIDALASALSGAQRLGGTVSVIRGLRGERETVASLSWAGVAFVGLDLWLDVTLKQTKEHSA